MPTAVVLLLVVFFGTGLWLLVLPVTPARLDRFVAAHSPELSAADRPRLGVYLAARRRARVSGVLVAATIGLFASVPQDRVDFALAPLLTGWLAGAIFAELSQRAGGAAFTPALPVARWWVSVPITTAVIAVLWTAAAVVLRSDGVRGETLLAWGSGALATVLAVRVMVGYMRRHMLRDLDPAAAPTEAGLAWATGIDAVRGLTIGGVTLALLCLGRVWIDAVPGPYQRAPELYPVLWLVAIVAVMLAVAAASVTTAVTGRVRWAAAAVAAVVTALPLVFAIPVRLAQEPPLSPQETGATARIRVVRPDGVSAAQAELGLKPDPPFGPAGNLLSMPDEFVVRVDVARPAPAGAYYQLFAFQRSNFTPVDVSGFNGSAWYGQWSAVLPARYPWLSNVVGVRDARGFSREPMAASLDPQLGLLWFRGRLWGQRQISADDLQVVLMLIRDDNSYIYWATPVPGATA